MTILHIFALLLLYPFITLFLASPYLLASRITQAQEKFEEENL